MNNPGQGIREETATAGRSRYPSLMGQLPAKLDADHALLPAWFENPNYRVVIGMVICDKKRVRMVHQAQEPEGSSVRIFPQETAKRIVDGTIRNTILRGMKEELGARDLRHVRVYPVELARFENYIPPERTPGRYLTKCILYFGVQVPEWMEFTPNPKEVRSVIRVTDAAFLQHGLASRLRKGTAGTDAVVAAMDAGLLDEQSWPAFALHLAQLRKSREEVRVLH